MRLREIADRLGCRLEGDGDIEIVRIASLKQAQPGDLSFVANGRYLGQMAATKASAVITVTPIDDSLVEGPETVVLTLTGGGTLVTPGPVTVTIAV